MGQDLSGQVAAITGAASGIGFACARAMPTRPRGVTVRDTVILPQSLDL